MTDFPNWPEHGTGSSSLPILDAREFVGYAESAADRGAKAQLAIDRAHEFEMQLLLPPWEIVSGRTLDLYDRQMIVGHGPNVSGFRLGDGSDVDLLKSEDYGVSTIANFTLRDFGLDGNDAGNAAGSCLLIDGITFLLDNLYIRNAAVDNLVERKTEPDGALRSRGEMDAFMRQCKLWDAGRYNVDWDGHDCHWTDVVAISAETRNFLVNTNAAALKAVNCHAYGGTDWPWEFRASCKVVGCEAEGGKEGQVLINSDHVKWLGGEAFTVDPGDGAIGFKWSAGKGFNCVIRPEKVKGCHDGAFDFTEASGGNSRISVGHIEQEGGAVVVGNPGESVQFDIGPMISPLGGEEGEQPELGFLHAQRAVYARQPEFDGEGNVDHKSIVRADEDSPTGFTLDDTSGGHYYAPAGNVLGSGGSAAAPGASHFEFVKVTIPNRTRITGIAYAVGATPTGNVRVAIYNSAGALLRSSASTPQGVASTQQKINFTQTIVLDPGDYYLLIQYASGLATAWKQKTLAPTGTGSLESFEAIPPTIVPVAGPENVSRPMLATY